MALKIVVLILACVAFECISAKLCMCGRENIDSRIVGGTLVSENRYPWMASLLMQKREGSKNTAWVCGGSLINDRYILTAAHCISDIPDKISAWLGSNVQFQGKRVKIIETIMAPFDSRFKRNDIALLKMDKPIEFTNEISPICLPTKDMTNFGQMTVAGWGKTSGGGESSEDLLEVTVPETPFRECNRRHGYALISSQMCASQIGRDSCGGDSGGPLMSRQRGKIYEAGIVSYGAIECGSDLDSVYTRVTSFLDWIKENTADAEYCDY